MARTCLTIILAAGEGSRMKSAKPKVLHEVAGLSLVGHVMKAALAAGGEAYAVVVGKEAEMVATETQKHASQVSTFLQTDRLGTAHAVLAARQSIEKKFDDILILFGDTPMVNPQTLRHLRNGLADGADVVVLGFKTNEPDGYGRLIEKDGQLLAIREHKDASPAELEINFCNGGNLAIAGSRALDLLDAVGNNNAKKEYYLTDVVEIARAKGLKVIAIEADQTETHGVNDRYELARIEEIWQQTTRAKMMRAGVTMQAPETVFLSYDTEIGLDAVIEPNVVCAPGVTIASGATIKAFSHLEGAQIGAGVVVGPFARLRPGTVLKTDSKVGNFCELKNAVVEEGAKVNHLSYIGDARVGVKANIGAGTITCNYDGANKFHTDIGAGSFIGSNSSLIAPVNIGEGAYIGSGSVITADVPVDAMAIARGRQHVKEGYGKVIRDRNAAMKAAKNAKK